MTSDYPADPAMDRQFVSYPKSGRTWIRFIMARLELEPLIRFHHDGFEFSDGGMTPHSFSESNRLEQYLETDKLVYLERDPRDVMVSLYHQITGRFGPVFNYRGDISQFLRDNYFGAENLKRFRDMWEEIAKCRGFLRISYEMCHADTDGLLRRVLGYYELKVPEAKLSRAIDDASIENMRKVEASMQFSEPWLRYRNGSPKVREGKVGGYREALDERDIDFLNEVFNL